MRVLILGGGRIGETIAKILITQRHDVILVEKDAARAKELDELLDANVVCGSASHADELFRIQASACEICFAVTGSDETNLVAASIVKSMGVRRVAAHIHSPSIRDTSTIDYQRHFGLDRILSIEALTAAEFANRVCADEKSKDGSDPDKQHDKLALEYFVGSDIELQEFVISKDIPASQQKPLSELQLPSDVRIGLIRRGSDVCIAGAQDIIQPGDRVTLIGEREQVENVKSRFRAISPKSLRIMIAGGGDTGSQIAEILCHRGHSVSILDIDRKRCEYLAEHLPKCTVIHADATNRTVLQSEQISQIDYFISCTGQDEENIIAALEAREYKSDLKTMVLSTRSDYFLLTSKLKIDETIVPASVIGSQVLGFLNSGPVLFRNKQLFNSTIDIVELEVREESAITKAALKDIQLPVRTLFGVVIRNGCVHVPSAKSQLHSGDVVVAFVQPESLPELVRLFVSTSGDKSAKQIN
ncbi:MAG: Trk system potassium transporter TrkA [Thermoguttaceae bacterium]